MASTLLGETGITYYADWIGGTQLTIWSTDAAGQQISPNQVIRTYNGGGKSAYLVPLTNHRLGLIYAYGISGGPSIGVYFAIYDARNVNQYSGFSVIQSPTPIVPNVSSGAHLYYGDTFFRVQPYTNGTAYYYNYNGDYLYSEYSGGLPAQYANNAPP